MTSHDIGRDLTAVTMGIDAFERSRTKGESLLDGEGLVPIYLGQDIVSGNAYTNWDEVDTDLTGLADRAGALEGGARKVFLEGMISSVGYAAKLFKGENLSFEEKVTGLVGAPAGREDAALIEDMRARLDTLLSQAGFARGTLRDRVEAWEADRAVPADKIEGVFRELMAKAKALTDEKVFDTGDYDMALNPIQNAHYTARCSFDEGKMDLNLDLHFTRAALKHLVCHEVFPGHSTQLLSTLKGVEDGEAPADALLITTNAVTGCVQEGIGDQGVHLIDFLEDADDEIHAVLRSLRSAVQTSAAWMLMAEGMAENEVTDYLRDVGMGQEAWVQGRLRMAKHPFRGPFISSYWAGNESVRRVRERVAPEQRPDFLKTLYFRANSPESLEMFPAIAD